MKRILVGLSGGVDSSVAAALLLEQGYEVTGAYMKNWINEENILGHCPWEQDIVDARAVADQLGIEFRVVNLMREYRERVVNYLLEGYRQGVTPNPDVMCNREMKFGVFLRYALDEGFDGIATGHYARLVHGETETQLLRGIDPNKDQSYFLALLRQDQIRRALFPVGDLLKPAVREVAQRLSLATAAKKDSQGICFIGEVRMTDFLRTFVPDQPGDIVNLEVKKLGQHQGLHLHTLGQRKGLRIPSNTYKEAYVVVAKRAAANELVVAFDRADTPLLYAKRCRLNNLSFTSTPIREPRALHAQPRYRTAAPLTYFQPEPGADGEWHADLTFDEPQRALTPGQICALYDGERLLGGGILESVEYE